jgi:hypothetical protein
MFQLRFNYRGPLVGQALAAVMSAQVLAVGVVGAPPSDSGASPAELAAIASATDWLVRETPTDPVAFLSLAVLERRFDIEAFEGMRQRYIQEIQSSQGRQQRRLRAFQRLLDADAPVEAADLEAITEGIDLLTSRALNCQRLQLPPDFELELRTAITTGGYDLTHAALALQWIEENGCSSAWSRRLHTLAIQQIAKIPDVDLRMTDLELEAATFLFYMGSEQLLPPGFVDSVLETQQPDGGWSGDSALDPDSGHWHATSLALWMLLEQASPEPIPMIPQ